MDENTKNSYMAGGIFLFVGIVFLYSGLSNNPQINMMSIIGTLITLAGGASFKYPQIGEVIFHWMKNHSGGASSSTTQRQNKPRNSPQAHTESGNIFINQTISESNSKRKK